MNLSITVDFPDDICKGPYDPARLDALMAAIAYTGVSGSKKLGQVEC